MVSWCKKGACNAQTSPKSEVSGSSGQTLTTNVSMTLCDSQIHHQTHVLCGCTTFGTESKLGPNAPLSLAKNITWVHAHTHTHMHTYTPHSNSSCGGFESPVPPPPPYGDVWCAGYREEAHVSTRKPSYHWRLSALPRQSNQLHAYREHSVTVDTMSPLFPAPEETLGYVACALAAGSTKRRKKMGSSVAYKTIGTFLSQNMGHEDACGWATEMQSGTPVADAMLYPPDL